MSLYLGTTATLSAEWRMYDGGPLSAVTGVQITITPLAGGSPVLGPTATGVSTPALGVNAYAWVISSGLPAGDYLVGWSGTDGQGDMVGATEIVSVIASTALGTAYASLAELKGWLGIQDSNTARDVQLQSRLDSATEDVNRWTHRQFGRDEVATSRKFPVGQMGVDTHDFWTAEDLAIVPFLGNVAGTPWDVSMMQLEPLDGIVDMMPGWPFNRICSGWSGHPLVTNLFYTATTVQVTAKWGWASVPKNINTACLLLAAMDNKSKDTPFGVSAFGDYAVRIRSNPMAQEKLDPYVKDGTAANSYMVAT